MMLLVYTAIVLVGAIVLVLQRRAIKKGEQMATARAIRQHETGGHKP